MPPARKINLLPAELKGWLKAELVARGFGGYEDLSEALNFRLEEAGSELRIQKTALAEFGAEHREFVKLNEQAAAWTTDWMTSEGLQDEANRHNILFQMITALAFKVMQAQMLKSGEEIDPKELHFLGRMMKDVMASSGIREAILAGERKRQSEKLDAAVAAGDIDADAADKARRIMGFAA